MHTDSPALMLVAEPQLDVARAGPGWFESSWDLRQGLVVTEATANADLWSALYRPPGRFTSLRTARPRSMTAIA